MTHETVRSSLTYPYFFFASRMLLIALLSLAGPSALAAVSDFEGDDGNLTTDAHLAALAISHGAVLASCDADFARFSRLRWHNPTAP